MANPQLGEIRISPKTGRKGQWDGRGWRIIDAPNTKDPTYKTAATNLAKEQQVYQQYRSRQPLLNQASDMVTGQTSGRKGKIDAGGLWNQSGMFGLNSMMPAFSEDANKFDNIGKQLQVGMRPPGQDSQVTNFERELFAAGSPGLNNYNSVNRAIIGRNTALNNEYGDKLTFMQEWLDTHGNLTGADEMWSDYTSHSPYYGKGKSGEMVALVHQPNQWRQYIYGKMFGQGQQQAQPQPQAPAKTAGGATASNW